ncbi:sensor kinase CusS [mine drainage metagenome]|uniref:histidine kinase n=1 Tax=mine drainage metagenome TaxID=410659 RepID=A0A1J5T8X8_9ZZZZ
MRIKYQITLLFTVLVTGILLFLCLLVYFISVGNQRGESIRKLQTRSHTTIDLLTQVPGINNKLLQDIDKKLFSHLQQQSCIIVYDSSYREIYRYTDSGAAPVTTDMIVLRKIVKGKDYFYQEKNRDVLALKFRDGASDYVVVSAAADKRGMEKLARLRKILLISFASGIIVTIFIGLLFSFNLLIPLKRMSKEMQEINSQNLVRRINARKNKDEINELVSNFNHLLDRLQNSFEIQKKFISNASHELLTPLTSVLSELDVILQKDRSNEDYKNVINSVHNDVKNLADLTKNLLEIAKASGESGGVELGKFRIDELMMRLPVELRKMNQAYSVNLDFNNVPDDESKVLVFGNSGLLYSAVSNIVINACKYSEDHTAGVTLKFIENQIQIIIDDNGPGIKEEDLPFIFNPFYRGLNGLDKHGFGLGLSLAQRIIKLHKGSIIATNKPIKGVTFIVTVPIA